MTNWQEQIQKGMELIKKGCEANQSWPHGWGRDDLMGR
jgi:hypothetical protein